MKRYNVLFMSLLVATFAAPVAFAYNCPGVNAEPTFQAIGSYWWYDYSPDSECVSYTSNLDPTTMWCYNEDSWEVDNVGWGRIEYEFTADPANEPWEASSRLEFNDPNNSSSNWVEVWVGVQYNSPSPTWTMLFSHNGTQGDLSCAKRGGHFEAPEGATITYIVEANKANSNVTIQIGEPILMSTVY
jgi:hypothetical protein